MQIWKRHFTLDELNQQSANCAIGYLGIRFSALGDDWIEATMPVDSRTVQPMGLLNGGISAALAESLGSVAGNCCLTQHQFAVGNEISASHLRPVRQGLVTARATPVRLGRSLQVWQIEIRDQQNKLCCLSRLTLSVISHE